MRFWKLWRFSDTIEKRLACVSAGRDLGRYERDVAWREAVEAVRVEGSKCGCPCEECLATRRALDALLAKMEDK